MDRAEPPDLDRDRLALEPDRAEPERDRRPAAGDRDPDFDRLELRDPDPALKKKKYDKIIHDEKSLCIITRMYSPVDF